MTHTTQLPAQKSGLHPMLWMAAVSVTAVSLVGIAAMTGILPGSQATPDTATTVAQPPAQAAVVAPAPATPPAAAPAAPAAPVAKTTAPAKPAASRENGGSRPATVYSSRPRTTEGDNDIEISRSEPQGSPRVYTSQTDKGYERPQDRNATCNNCGVIESVNTVTEKGEGTGIGAVAGGVVGGIIGNQIGGGKGRDLARIAGIAGGAYAGHEIEKRQRGRTIYEVNVRLEDGSLRTFRQETQPSWQAGDRVRIEDGVLTHR